jgi:CRISPR-associated protein Cmr1
MYKQWQFRALTNIWTGNIEQKPKNLILTGIMGSLRWWFEVLVRGLGGKACDPSAKESRCPDKQGRRCVVCELFGCTGWARKFRLMIVDEHGQLIQKQIKEGQTFILRFIPLHFIQEEEWCLLDLTLRLIAEYGAIGGKTVFKPSDETKREGRIYHQDFGLISLDGSPDHLVRFPQEHLEAYVQNGNGQWRTNIDDTNFTWASLKNFWCVNRRYLTRMDANTSSFNFVIERHESKSQSKHRAYDSWLAGRSSDRQTNIDPESKKVFSFKQSSRTFGFVQNPDRDFDLIIEKLEELRERDDQHWSNFQRTEFQIGENLLRHLF